MTAWPIGEPAAAGVYPVIFLDAIQSAHPYQYADESQVEVVRTGPPGLGFVLTIPVPDLDTVYELWRTEGPKLVRVFFGRDLDGYGLMFEQFH